MVDNLSGSVANFIVDRSWVFPPLLQLHFPALCELVSQVPIALDPSTTDTLVWSSSSSGELTAKVAFHFLRQPSPSVDWGRCIWSKFILPRMSLLTWKVLRGRVLCDDFMQKRGIALASRCVLCRKDCESLSHIFRSCPFAETIWSCMIAKFELAAPPLSLYDMLQLELTNGRSPQLKELWVACFTSVLWFLWHARNKAKYDNRFITVVGVCRLVFGHIQSASRIASGHMHNSIQDLRILKCFGVTCRPRHAPRTIEVNWHPPFLGWIKINSDGAWKHDSARVGYGVVFRDYRGYVLGAFASNFDIPSSVAAEVMAVIKVIELAWVRDWKHVWLEVDSSLILDFLWSPSLVPWQLRVQWNNCLFRISQMNFHSSHIFREGNHVADALANYGTSSTDFV
ncbi:putative ribonuclease H-like domain, reverse transcriptase zinc-binding domain-containing protein [Rosa chinensis]|uniref:Putative ribonuclease H-like domain, reverse transcriptase zinc-binding domain-containing protein n=1 Tax=Rosa chinensis TaxID=74649 RepID=A0A2P6RUM9_ROSCH|nr:putative ribonuclease H-like domain, reverse transcriptase zinc-binding domain-containing protein [Rosa chinensis]